MKRHLTFVFLCLFSSTMLVANIAPPQVYISEVYIDSSGNWTLELGMHIYNFLEIDSIQIETSGGHATIGQFTFLPGAGYPGFDSLAIITNANLSNPLTLDIAGDFVLLISFSSMGNPVSTASDYVSFGNYPGSFIPEMDPEESIAYVCYTQSQGYCSGFCLDASPSLGLPNDTTGCLATLQGVVFDTNGMPFTEGWFPFVLGNVTISIQPDGSYSERIFAREYDEDTIVIAFPPWPYTHCTYTIAPVNPVLFPDSVVYCDFHTTSVVSSIQESEQKKPQPVVYPNPFTNSVTFYLPDDGNTGSGDRISVFTESGVMIFDREIPSGQSQVTWDTDLTVPPGTYIYRYGGASGGFQTGKLIKLAR